VGYTLVSFHAHPDDESMLTGGTLARMAAEGHRVVLVVATAGEAGLTGPCADDEPLGVRRARELRRAAEVLGVARVVELGYPDSGSDTGSGGGGPAFSTLDVSVAARRLAAVLEEEKADALTVYDAQGGYGHPDHIQVHRAGVAAAELAGTSVVLEATADRDRMLRALRWVPGLPAGFSTDALSMAYSPHSSLTHRIDVRRFVEVKRAAMAAHATQTAGPGPRNLDIYLRLPGVAFRFVFGHEWFIERGRTPGDPLLDDLFGSLR
jgi:LmbE family N-acetylglucosaminyl deacetylase